MLGGVVPCRTVSFRPDLVTQYGEPWIAMRSTYDQMAGHSSISADSGCTSRFEGSRLAARSLWSSTPSHLASSLSLTSAGTRTSCLTCLKARSGRGWEQEVEALAGSYVWKPRNVLHTFWNLGPEPARILETISPAGFDNFFEELAVLLQHSPPPTDEAVYGLCDRYGLTFDRSWLPELESRFGAMRMV